MPSSPSVVLSSIAAPALLLVYGICRMADGLDGTRGPGIAWNVGHAMFFLAFVLLAVLILGLRPMIPIAAPWQRVVANGAVVTGLAGSLCFLWVILGDLFPRFDDEVPFPDPLRAAGPLLFQVGLLTLLVQLVMARPRQLPLWSPVLVLLGFVMIAADLDLLPLAAVLICCGLGQLVRRRHRDVRRPDPGKGRHG